jgi:hypothetical protein
MHDCGIVFINRMGLENIILVESRILQSGLMSFFKSKIGQPESGRLKKRTGSAESEVPQIVTPARNGNDLPFDDIPAPSPELLAQHAARPSNLGGFGPPTTGRGIPKLSSPSGVQQDMSLPQGDAEQMEQAHGTAKPASPRYKIPARRRTYEAPGQSSLREVQYADDLVPMQEGRWLANSSQEPLKQSNDPQYRASKEHVERGSNYRPEDTFNYEWAQQRMRDQMAFDDIEDCYGLAKRLENILSELLCYHSNRLERDVVKTFEDAKKVSVGLMEGLKSDPVRKRLAESGNDPLDGEEDPGLGIAELHNMF